MALSTLSDAAATIAALSGVGAFIDFVIGKNGQKRVRDALATWWLLLSYTTLSNFVRKEASIAMKSLDSVFGSRFLSARRFVSILFLGIPAYLAACVLVDQGYFSLDADSETLDSGILWRLSFMVQSFWEYWSGSFAYDVILGRVILLSCIVFSGFSVSISLTRFVLNKSSELSDSNPRQNVMIFISIMLGQIILFEAAPVLFYIFASLILSVFYFIVYGYAPSGLQDSISRLTDLLLFPFQGTLRDRLSVNLLPMEYPGFDGEMAPILAMGTISGTGAVLSLLANAFRLLVAAAFFVSLLLMPFKQKFMWLINRIVESDRPTFTLLFGGLGAAAKAIGAIHAYLSV